MAFVRHKSFSRNNLPQSWQFIHCLFISRSCLTGFIRMDKIQKDWKKKLLTPCNIKVVYSSSHVESTVTLDSQLHRDYYTILHGPFTKPFKFHFYYCLRFFIRCFTEDIPSSSSSLSTTFCLLLIIRTPRITPTPRTPVSMQYCWNKDFKVTVNFHWVHCPLLHV